MTLLMTQSYRDSGFEGLIPMGIAYIRADYKEGKANLIKSIREEFEEQGIQYVFNCKFEFWFNGHPNNGVYGGEVIGDAYKLPKDVTTVLVPEGGEIVTRVRTKKGWMFRCGLVTIEE